MTIDDFIAAVEASADQALPPTAVSLLGPSKVLPPSQGQVEAFEAEIGTTLPDEYRRFLLRCNGGKVDWYRFEGLTPEGKSWTAVISDVGGLREEPELSLRFTRSCYQGHQLQIPRTLLWIMGDRPRSIRSTRPTAAAGLQREDIDGDIGPGRGDDTDYSGNVRRLAAQFQVRLSREPDGHHLTDCRAVADISTR
jgi:hypothetical protein